MVDERQCEVSMYRARVYECMYVGCLGMYMHEKQNECRRPPRYYVHPTSRKYSEHELHVFLGVFFFFVCDEIGAVGGRPTTAGISERLQHSVFFISVPVA